MHATTPSGLGRVVRVLARGAVKANDRQVTARMLACSARPVRATPMDGSAGPFTHSNPRTRNGSAGPFTHSNPKTRNGSAEPFTHSHPKTPKRFRRTVHPLEPENPETV